MLDCTCRICGMGFTHLNLQGRHVEIYSLCDSCIRWHKSCKRGNHFPLRSAFTKNGAARDGLQDTCRDCLSKTRYRSLTCAECDVDFLVSGKSGRHNGNHIPFCDDCYLIVKSCGSCKEIKPLDEFGDRPDRRNGKKSSCKECLSRQWRDMSVEEQFAKTRGAKYGISYDDYLAMHLAQGGFCAICNSPETDINSRTGEPQRLSVDHCHTTGLVRALLCGKCNKALGLLGDDIDRLESAIDYLKKWTASHAQSIK